jgi:IPT/TIG domain
MPFYMRTLADANSNDAYLPKTMPEKAGCPGAGTAVPSDPNYSFASTIKAGSEKTPYPTGGGGGAAILDTVAAVETTATLNITDTSLLPGVTSVSPNTGLAAGGTAVTISGTGFTGATGVTFGGTAATAVVVVNATTITCTSPAKAAGTYDVRVTTPNGQSPIGLSDNFIYT